MDREELSGSLVEVPPHWPSLELVERTGHCERAVPRLDPDVAVGWPAVVKTAERIRERLDGLGLAAYVKTTGGKGLHVVAPLRPEAGWDECAEFARDLTEAAGRILLAIALRNFFAVCVSNRAQRPP